VAGKSFLGRSRLRAHSCLQTGSSATGTAARPQPWPRAQSVAVTYASRGRGLAGSLLRRATLVFARPRKYPPIWHGVRPAVTTTAGGQIWMICAATRAASVAGRCPAVPVSARLWRAVTRCGPIVVGSAVTRCACALGSLRLACLPGYGRASSTMLNWFWATLRTWLYPASASTARSCDSPACEPRPRPTGWESEAGTHRNVDAA
jgi:hypothetical protein